MFKYNSLNNYFKNRFGKKVYKIAIDCGFSCPNRDGTKGTGGCIFCSQVGSGEFAIKGTDIKEQLKLAKEKVSNKIKGDKGYVCYFQSFTNTYAPVEKLREIYFRFR